MATYQFKFQTAAVEELCTLYRNRKPLLIGWSLVLFVCTSGLYSYAHINMLAPTPGFAHDRPLDRSTKVRRQMQEVVSEPASSQEQQQPTVSQATLLDLPVASPPPARGGIIFFQHVVKTGGTTIRDNFMNQTKFPQVDYRQISVRSRFDKMQKKIDIRLSNPEKWRNTTLFVEIHGHDTPTLVELAPILKDWKQKAKAANVPFYAFTLLRDPGDFAVSFFNHFHVFGDRRFGPPMEGTVSNLQTHLQTNPQCLYLFKGERAYMRPRHRYTVTEEDCHQIKEILQDGNVMDWVGDTKHLSQDTLPLLTYWVTGQASLSQTLGSSNVAEKRHQRYQPLSKKAVDKDTKELIQSRSTLDQALYETAVTTRKEVFAVATY